jgi:hypothetical protein
MAKHKKYPKKPKQSAPLSSWESYTAKCKAVDKHNAEIERDKKKKASIIKKHS